MEFVEGRIDGEKVFGGLVFPKTLLPAAVTEDGTADSLVAAVEAERELLVEILRAHGAILFRGFNISTSGDFERVVEAFGWENTPFTGLNIRVQYSERVFSSNESPPENQINFHHENSRSDEISSKIFFNCIQPSPEGGETSIVLSSFIVEKMEQLLPDVLSKISDIGYLYHLKTVVDEDGSGKNAYRTWQTLLKTNDQTEAKKRARKMFFCDSLEFNADGSANIVYGPLNPIMELQGKRVWFHSIMAYTGGVNDVNSTYGDGSEFPLEALIEYQKVLEESCVDVKWEKGDVLLIDNLAVQHARRAGKPPRRLLASICK